MMVHQLKQTTSTPSRDIFNLVNFSMMAWAQPPCTRCVIVSPTKLVLPSRLDPSDFSGIAKQTTSTDLTADAVLGCLPSLFSSHVHFFFSVLIPKVSVNPGIQHLAHHLTPSLICTDELSSNMSLMSKSSYSN